jgi:hypothetical protein
MFLRWLLLPGIKLWGGKSDGSRVEPSLRLPLWDAIDRFLVLSIVRGWVA